MPNLDGYQLGRKTYTTVVLNPYKLKATPTEGPKRLERRFPTVFYIANLFYKTILTTSAVNSTNYGQYMSLQAAFYTGRPFSVSYHDSSLLKAI